MARFPFCPDLHPCEEMRGGERVFALVHGLSYPNGDYVPVGFKTDGISFPRVVRSFLAKMGKGFSTAIGHDYDYAVQEGTRKEADYKAYKRWQQEGLPQARAYTYYVMLRHWGWIAWNNNKKRDRSYFFEDLESLKLSK
jgi:hypothetical protein|tara:strand:+ start:252 stop:668 length:417 start_codon:yes stop_codon:yes gene_type:complete